ncbi:Ribosome-associated translation inhibitor RaiA [Filimonas lacunae]|uniref:Ribosome-associated translation inhibitor RaiA n=1 Tax=Filimonas lacunae TaxID=477680 RepID=A0A173MDK2_9BACT|nr:HPF/RaiA family ribosome-associated protein [Filimonas lacunae]BAV05664.1 hypothetical protein FLA_1675 [Filimonas lacunae]SIT28988.1 Ribosome-associated translation inhibitor RaiA [Filimonas lacunae]
MDIIIQSLGFNAGETLESFIREKLHTLKSDQIIRADVTLFKGPDSTPENNYCEIRLEVPGYDPFVKKTGIYFENAVSECIDVLKLQLNKTKDKQTQRQHADAIKVQDAIMEAENDADDSDVELEDVVK